MAQFGIELMGRSLTVEGCPDLALSPLERSTRSVLDLPARINSWPTLISVT